MAIRRALKHRAPNLKFSIGSKQDQELDQEQKADLDLRLFSEENSRFSEFDSASRLVSFLSIAETLYLAK
jgi:hypothetical protein